MSLLGRTAGDPSGTGRAAVERWLRESRARLEPDPLFRRRLRSDVMNAWVAAHEGIGQPPPRRWVSNRMGTLGRACLYTSVALCASIAGVMAASSQALPGDPLYAVKLRIEELRVEALPSQFQDELAVDGLAERVQEMRRLAAAGSLDEALALAPAVERQYAEIEERIRTGDIERSTLLVHRLGVVARLIETLPPDLSARVAELTPGLSTVAPTVAPTVDAPAPSDVKDGGPEAAPADPAPVVQPPAAPAAQPNADAVAPSSDQADTGASDAQGGVADEDNEDSEASEGEKGERDSDGDGD